MEEKQYDTKLYQRKLRRAERTLRSLEKKVDRCSTDELDDALRLYRAAELKVRQLKDRLQPPKSTYEVEIVPLNAHTYDK